MFQTEEARIVFTVCWSLSNEPYICHLHSLSLMYVCSKHCLPSTDFMPRKVNSKSKCFTIMAMSSLIFLIFRSDLMQYASELSDRHSCGTVSCARQKLRVVKSIKDWYSCARQLEIVKSIKSFFQPRR